MLASCVLLCSMSRFKGRLGRSNLPRFCPCFEVPVGHMQLLGKGALAPRPQFRKQDQAAAICCAGQTQVKDVERAVFDHAVVEVFQLKERTLVGMQLAAGYTAKALETNNVVQCQGGAQRGPWAGMICSRKSS